MSDDYLDGKLGWPGDRVPVTVLLDDPTPCRNPMWYEFPEAGHVAEIPNGFLERFCDVAERTGAAGKFSVVPCPGARGRIDETMPGIEPGEIAAFVRIVRERVAPRWDISPELLTHNKALDLATMMPLDEREDAWAAHQDEATLRRYITRGLEILRNVGLEPNGVTSPWSLGREVEGAYARAIEAALRAVCGVTLGWYFLHIDAQSPDITPRVAVADPAEGAALVSIYSGSPAYTVNGHTHADFAWRTQYGEPPATDLLLTADGTAGRLHTLFHGGGPITFHTHWQSMFSNGSGAGLAAFEDLAGRINAAWGQRVRWTAARELALATAARAHTRFRRGVDEGTLVVEAPYRCPDCTFDLPGVLSASEVRLDGVALERVAPGGAGMSGGTWYVSNDRVRVCATLPDGATVTWR